MWDRRKLLLTAILFYCKVTAESTKMLDLAPDAVDYLYTGCREAAKKNFIQGLLTQELNSNEDFQRAWNNSKCQKVTPGLTQEHTTALSVYADEASAFTRTFDKAVETKGGNVSTYEKDFHFKALHFLLMDSMKQNECMTMYAVRDDSAQMGSTVRFAKFTKVETSYNQLKELNFDGQVVFNITSCFFAKLGDNICSKDSNMALLSPAEVFTVVGNTDRITLDGDFYTEITLKHKEVKPSHNCVSLSRSPAGVPTQWLVLMLVALPLLFNY